MTKLVNFYQCDTRILMYHMHKMERKVLRISGLKIIVLVSLHRFTQIQNIWTHIIP